MLAQQASEATWAADYPWLGISSGLVILVVGADLLVRGAVWIALVLGMSRMSVGLTLVAIGTSLPELLVTLTAAQEGRSSIAMANVVGSNASNTLFIIGAAAAIQAIRLQVRWLELNWSLIATAVLGLPFVLGIGLERGLAAGMILMLLLFCAHLLKREASDDDDHRPRVTALGWIAHLALIVAGFFGLKYGADWLVGGGVVVATSMGLSDAFIGLMMAIGTSLPELATSIIAAIRKQPEICIGNVLGSNIFNVGAVLGICGLIHPFAFDHDDLWLMMTVTAISAVVFVVVLKAFKGVPRFVGILFLLAYFGFLVTVGTATPS